ncbi:MAG: LysR family transcriptional regulator [Ruminiclostridium sp.]|jgi:DNA-binding transcriptional LysR family regulator|nr:LysR family transcriptional regulator [Ruminiclostridium sp.]
MSIKKYEVLLKTADLGSFTKTSEVLGYTQSAISHIVTSLEEELGIKLLLRDRFGVRLTQEGEALLPAIREVCQKNQEVERQVALFHDLEVGQVRIGTFLSVSVHLLPGLLHDFSQRHPHITFELLQGSYEDIEHWLSDGRIDMGFLRLPASGSFESILLLEERFLAIFPQDQPPAADGPFPVSQLEQAPYIMRPDSVDAELRDILRKAKYEPRITYSAKDDYAVMAMVEQGLGMSILPELLLRRIPYQLTTRELDPPARRQIGIACKSIQNLPPAARQFLNYVKKSVVR